MTGKHRLVDSLEKKAKGIILLIQLRSSEPVFCCPGEIDFINDASCVWIKDKDLVVDFNRVEACLTVVDLGLSKGLFPNNRYNENWAEAQGPKPPVTNRHTSTDASDSFNTPLLTIVEEQSNSLNRLLQPWPEIAGAMRCYLDADFLPVLEHSLGAKLGVEAQP